MSDKKRYNVTKMTDVKVHLTCVPTKEGVCGERMWAEIPETFLAAYNDDADFESTIHAVLVNNSVIYESLAMFTPIVIRCNGPHCPEILSWEVL